MLQWETGYLRHSLIKTCPTELRGRCPTLAPVTSLSITSPVHYGFSSRCPQDPRAQVFSKGAFNEGKHFHCRDSCDCDRPHAPIWTPEASATAGPIRAQTTGHVPEQKCPVWTLPSSPCWATTVASACHLVRPTELKEGLTRVFHSLLCIHPKVPDLPSSVRSTSNGPSSRKLSLILPSSYCFQ